MEAAIVNAEALGKTAKQHLDAELSGMGEAAPPPVAKYVHRHEDQTTVFPLSFSEPTFKMMKHAALKHGPSLFNPHFLNLHCHTSIVQEGDKADDG